MAEAQTSTRQKVGDRVESIAEGLGGVAKATAEATTEATVGAVRVTTDVCTGIAKSFADTFVKAVSDSAEVFQDSIRKLFSLDAKTESKAEAKKN